MSFPRDAYPYTNFHELNLGYFIVHFREIFSQWADMYDQMLDWKDATTDELTAWKTGVEADLDQREATLRAELETWKAQTGQDIAGWEDATLAALTAWQTATQAVFEAIRVEAAGSASAAAASAGDAATAKTAAETAQAAAEAAAASVQASATQIATNTEDIADLKTQLNDANFYIRNPLTLSFVQGNIGTTGANAGSAQKIRTNDYYQVNNNIEITFDKGSYGNTIFLTIFRYGEDNVFIDYEHRVNAGTFIFNIGTAKSLRFVVQPGSGDSTTIINPADGPSLVTATKITVQNLRPDTSLTNEGDPADAKAAGDAIRALSFINTDIQLSWENGLIGSSGNNSGTGNPASLRTPQPKMALGIDRAYYSIGDGYQVRFCFYASDGTFLDKTGQTTGDGYIDLSDGKLLRITFTAVDNSNVTPDDGFDNFSLSKQTGVIDFLETQNSDNTRNRNISYMSFSIFEKFGVIGDSFASGSIHHPDDGGWTGNYAMSWPQILARKTGTTGINFTKGGLSCKTWLSDTDHGLSALLAADPQQLYIIALGINDNTQIEAGTETLGTINDINLSDFTQNPDSFFGNYGRIIGNIQSHAPYAKIALLSVARLNERNMDQYIEQIAEKCGLPYIDLTDDPYFTSTTYYGSMVSSHPLTYGYAGMANAIERLIILDVLKNTGYWGTYYGLVDADTSVNPED